MRMIRLNKNYDASSNEVGMTLMEKMREFGIASSLSLDSKYYYVFKIASDYDGTEKLFCPIAASASTGDLNEGDIKADRFQLFSFNVDFLWDGASYSEQSGYISFTGSVAISGNNDNQQWTYGAWAINGDIWPKPTFDGASWSSTLAIPYGATASYLLETGRLLVQTPI